jgi:hypothetical protein
MTALVIMGQNGRDELLLVRGVVQGDVSGTKADERELIPTELCGAEPMGLLIVHTPSFFT